MKAAILGLALAAALLVAVMIMRGGTAERGSNASAPPQGNVTVTRRHAPDVVLSIRPDVRTATPTGATPGRTAFTPLMHELAKRREYKTMYEKLKASASRTAEENYVLAQILENCAHVTDRRPPRKSGWRLGGEEARVRFIASLGDKDPGRDKRLAAFDRINVDPCAGFEEVQSTEKEINGLLAQAAASDPKAKAALLLRELEGPSRDGLHPAISDAQLATIREVLSSGDPRALVDIVGVFALHLRDFSVRTGADEAPLEYWAMHGAATLAACDLGYPCGPDSRFLLEACALQGQCDAANYRDYWFYYYSSPSTSQRASQYHDQLMRGIREGDWSFFTFHRKPPPGYAPFERR